jgi:crotonobetainyl-CoA:carnitine CoA-transferase CaiB-like acyl-CoA transferase
MGQANQQAPLSGVRVIELSHYVAGPLAARMMSDLGAEVIKIELAPRGDLTRYYPPLKAGVSPGFIAFNRGKRGVCIDIKRPEGARLVTQLIGRADVMVENFSPGVLAKYGLDYQHLHQRHPRLIMCSMSGFGQNGPLASKQSNDLIAMGMSGMLHMIGDPEGKPMVPSILFGDCNGAVHIFGSVCAALYMRERTGKGQYIDLSLDECLGQFADFSFALYQATGGKHYPNRAGSHFSTVSPMGVFRARDGDVTIAAALERWRQFCKAIGQPELATDPRFDTMERRIANREALTEIIENWLQSFPGRNEPLAILEQNRILCGPVLDVPQSMSHPHRQARGTLQTVSSSGFGELQTFKTPIRFSNAEVAIRGGAPLLGEHNGQVLGDLLGYSSEQVAALTTSGVLVQDARLQRIARPPRNSVA